MNNKQLASKLIDLISDCMENDCKEEARALLQIAKSMVNKERKKMTGKKTIPVTPRKASSSNYSEPYVGCHPLNTGGCH